MPNDISMKDLREIVERVLSERVGKYGLNDVRVQVGYDHDDDPALFIDAYYRLVDASVDPAAFYGLTGEVRRELAKHGEYKFPYIRNHFDESQKVAV